VYQARCDPHAVLGEGGAYQTLGWIKEAHIDWHFTHIGDLQSAWANACVVHGWPKVECPGRRDAVLAEHSPCTDLYISRLIVEICSTSLLAGLQQPAASLQANLQSYAQLFCCPHSSTQKDLFHTYVCPVLSCVIAAGCDLF